MGGPPNERRPTPLPDCMRADKDVENSTLAMLQALRTAKSVPGKELLRLIDEHQVACEDFAEVLPPACARVSKLTSTLRADLRGSGFKELQPADAGASGIFSELLSSLGVTLDTSQPQGHGLAEASAPLTLPAPSASTSRDEGEQASELGQALEHLEQGPAKALQAGRRAEGELKEMLKVLERLRASWPELRASVEGAFQGGTHIRTKELGASLKQVLHFRRQFRSALPSIETLCDLLEDAMEQVREREEERLRFKAMSRELLDGQRKALSARIAAVLWLKQPSRSSSSSSSARPEQTRFDIEQASEALERNLEAAKDMERRLVKGASSVMRRETNHQVVQRTVARLSVLRGKVVAAAEAVSSARADLAGARKSSQHALTEAAGNALQRLMATIDEAAATALDAGGGQGGSASVLRNGEEAQEEPESEEAFFVSLS
eukprot:TRINITY_DN34863_c0_g1_i1.p1 TRINITY_DN34863_c0_g1~~TRINITY_DN34863_c0_g1_i1.p1  ORF type:complete len:436 (+),score=117.00 TRINITY_DN34863_c0_g1_i1:109-1416(+)